MLRKAVNAIFLEHPRTVDESYGEHMFQAMRFSARMFIGAQACFIHALIPRFFAETGSKTIRELNERMIEKRRSQTRHRDRAENNSVVSS